MTGPWYATLPAARLACGLTAAVTTHDERIKTLLESVSRGMELHCGRWFYPRLETRVYSGAYGGVLRLGEDLLELTSLKTDHDGDGTFETTWLTTDYRLMPVNARLGANPEPYWEIGRKRDGSYYFPSCEEGVQVVGKWGYFDLHESAGTLGAAIADGVTTALTMNTGHALEVGNTLLIGSEQLFVTAVASNALTATRGVSGTTAAAHNNGALVEKYTYGKITGACLQQIALDYLAGSAPGGIQGSAQLGGSVMSGDRVAGGLHPFVRRDLASYVRLVFA